MKEYKMKKVDLERLVAKLNAENATLEMKYKARDLKVKWLEAEAKKAKHAYRQAEHDLRAELKESDDRIAGVEELIEAEKARASLTTTIWEQEVDAHKETKAEARMVLRAVMGWSDAS